MTSLPSKRKISRYESQIDYLRIAREAGLQYGRTFAGEKCSIQCPACDNFKRNGSATVLFLKTGVIKCLKCDISQHVTSLVNTPDAQLPTFQVRQQPVEKRTGVIDVERGLKILEGSQDKAAQTLRKWVSCDRKWPLELAARLPGDVLVIPRAKAALRSDASSRAILKYAEKHAYRLVFAMRDEHGRRSNAK